MDVEGAEVIVIPEMRDYLMQEKPLLHLSLHPSYLDKDTRSERISNIFKALDFYREVLDENGQPANPDDYLQMLPKNLEFTAFLFIP